MELTYNGSYGYDGDAFRAIAHIPDPVSGVYYAQSPEREAEFLQMVARDNAWRPGWLFDAAAAWDASAKTGGTQNPFK